MNTQHTAGRTLPSRWGTVPSPLQDGEPSEQGPSHLKVGDLLTLMSHCQAGYLCRELLGREEAITKDNEALEYALSSLLGAVELHGCHCPSQSRVSPCLCPRSPPCKGTMKVRAVIKCVGKAPATPPPSQGPRNISVLKLLKCPIQQIM